MRQLLCFLQRLVRVCRAWLGFPPAVSIAVGLAFSIFAVGPQFSLCAHGWRYRAKPFAPVPPRLFTTNCRIKQ